MSADSSLYLQFSTNLNLHHADSTKKLSLWNWLIKKTASLKIIVIRWLIGCELAITMLNDHFGELTYVCNFGLCWLMVKYLSTEILKLDTHENDRRRRIFNVCFRWPISLTGLPSDLHKQIMDFKNHTNSDKTS